jgi:hypothetical protein
VSEKRCHYAEITETRHGWHIRVNTPNPLISSTYWRPTRKAAERLAERKLRRAHDRDRFERERDRYEIRKSADDGPVIYPPHPDPTP